MFPSVRSIAVIGNAPSILESPNGRLIDSHDLVVRFNRARTAGLEEQIGSRTDVLFANLGNTLAKAPSPAETIKPKATVCFVSPQRRDLHEFDAEPFREWVGDGPLLFTFIPDLIGLDRWPRSRPFTSGTYALYLLLRLLPVERLFVTGFTMFGAVPGGAGKYWHEALPNAALAHDIDHEGKLFSRLLREFPGELTVTEEVRALARQNGVELGKMSGERRRAKRTLRVRAADALAWRLQAVGMNLRRLAESSR
jgi:hypothetical protein